MAWGGVRNSLGQKNYNNYCDINVNGKGGSMVVKGVNNKTTNKALASRGVYDKIASSLFP